MDELITWLREQVDLDQKAAEEMKKVFPTPWELADRGWMVRIVADGPCFREVVRLEQRFAPDGYAWLSDAVEHVFLQDPDRALREVEAKREIIRKWEVDHGNGYPDYSGGYESALEDVIAVVAATFSDRPGYQESWRP